MLGYTQSKRDDSRLPLSSFVILLYSYEACFGLNYRSLSSDEIEITIYTHIHTYIHIGKEIARYIDYIDR